MLRAILVTLLSLIIILVQGRGGHDHWGDAVIESLKVICDDDSGTLCQADCNAMCANATKTQELSNCLTQVSRNCWIKAEIIVVQPADQKKVCWVTVDNNRGGAGWLYQSNISRGWDELTLISFELEFQPLTLEAISEDCRGQKEHIVGLGGDPIMCIFQSGVSDHEKLILADFGAQNVLRVDLAHLLDILVDQHRVVAIKPVNNACVFPVGAIRERGKGILFRRGTYTNLRHPSAATSRLHFHAFLIAEMLYALSHPR